jgi:hypothetical protein
MRYEAYRKAVARAAKALGGEEVSLAGGFYGVELDAPTFLGGTRGVRIVLALDLDAWGAPHWCAWLEDRDGEQCCDIAAEDLGVFRPSEYRALRPSAIAMLGQHTHAAFWSPAVSVEGGADFPPQTFPV